MLIHVQIVPQLPSQALESLALITLENSPHETLQITTADPLSVAGGIFEILATSSRVVTVIAALANTRGKFGLLHLETRIYTQMLQEKGEITLSGTS